jgi:hypothetical protein
MATLDTSLYLVGLGTVVLAVYLSQPVNFEKLLIRVTALLPTCLGGKSGIHQPLETFDSTSSLESLDVKHTTPPGKYSPTWWTDEKIFQLERRAVFSKVQDLLRVHATQLTFELELAVCNSCFPIPEGR